MAPAGDRPATVTGDERLGQHLPDDLGLVARWLTSFRTLRYGVSMKL
jgi:hypothetical protein